MIKLNKKILIIILCVILIFAGFKYKKIYRYFAEQRYYSILVMLDLAKPCYDPYKKRADIFIHENFDYKKENKKVVLDSLEKTSKELEVKTSVKIPLITHQIYFTQKNRTKPLPIFYIKKMKATYSKLNNISKDWQHFIWTNNPDLFSNEIKNIKGVQFKSIDEFKQNSLYNILIQTIDKGNELVAYLAESSDLFRLLALQKHGGVYYDMDYEIYNAKELLKYMQNFDFLGGRETVNSNSYYGNSFLAAKPDHPVINQALSLMMRNYHPDSNSPLYVQYPCTENDRLYFNGPPLITLAYFAKNNIDNNNDVILPGWMVLNLYFSHFKNKYCDYSKITKEEFEQNNQNLNQLIEEFTQSFKQTDINNFYKIQNNSSKEEDNIYYNLKYRNQFPIIGADMGCGTWVTAKNPRHFYWK